MDFTALLSALDFANVMTALASVAAIIVLPNIARWGYRRVISWFDPDDAYLDELYDNEEDDNDGDYSDHDYSDDPDRDF